MSSPALCGLWLFNIGKEQVNMGATLDALCRLQEVELQIAEIQRRINRKHRLVEKQDKRLSQIDAQIKGWQEAIRKEKMEADAIELDVKSREAEIVKLRQALNTTKTNKEYSAILTELNTKKADYSKLEEKGLGVLNQLEAKNKELETVQKDRESEQAKRDELAKSAADTEDKSRERMNKLKREREAAAEAVPPSALQIFDRVSEKHDGEAMAGILRTHPKRAEYACEGCNMSINIEQVNSVLSRDEPITCNNCGRILFYETAAAPTR